ncbi:MAG: biopolymer transporter ExbD [Cyanobacteria bacterium P01_F01_bin.150]
MNVRRRQFKSQLPEVNLVPLMDVLMSVLTFFIIISMNLSSQNILTVEAPSPDDFDGAVEEETVEPLVVGLNKEGQLLIADQQTDVTILATEIRQYLSKTPNGYVRLKADRELEYNEVTRALITLRDIGSGQVSLAIE